MNKAELLNKINSGDSQQLAEAIQEFQENGDLDIAGALLEHIGQITDPRQQTILSNLLADIKDSKFRNLLVNNLQQAGDNATRAALLRIIWESTLDYSGYLETLLPFLEAEDFTVAFEASTVLENLVHHLSLEQQDLLYQTASRFPEEKQYLVSNILEALEQFATGDMG